MIFRYGMLSDYSFMSYDAFSGDRSENLTEKRSKIISGTIKTVMAQAEKTIAENSETTKAIAERLLIKGHMNKAEITEMVKGVEPSEISETE